MITISFVFMNLYKKKILVIVAHTDDESIGCGGLIKKLSLKKNKVAAISFTNGISARAKSRTKEINNRRIASIKASKILGFNWLEQYDYPDNQLDTVSLLEIVKVIEKHKKQFKPHIILTHNFSDLNIDHRKIAEACLTAFRPEPNEKLEQFLTFEVPSATDFRNLKNKNNFLPNYFVNIDNFLIDKIKAIRCYKKEIKPYPHSRSVIGIKNLNKIRGNQSGLKYAEAFEIIRKIEIN
jgi:LmbE family N-acetylglucosaminyl deacetylase